MTRRPVFFRPRDAEIPHVWAHLGRLTDTVGGVLRYVCGTFVYSTRIRTSDAAAAFARTMPVTWAHMRSGKLRERGWQASSNTGLEAGHAGSSMGLKADLAPEADYRGSSAPEHEATVRHSRGTIALIELVGSTRSSSGPGLCRRLRSR